jgi:hypothetical protein
MSIMYIQDDDGNYIPVSRYPYPNYNHSHFHTGSHQPYPGYHGHSGVNPYPSTHSYGYGVPGGSAYGYYNVAHGAFLGHDWIGLPRIDQSINAHHAAP